MKRTNAQNARFHALLTERKFDKEEKSALVLTYTGGRSESSADMTFKEMAEAIKHLEGLEMASIRKMRAKIINIAKEIFGVADMSQSDWDNLNVFLVSKFKAKLNELSYDQLIKAVTGMQGWKKSEDKKRAKQATHSDIPTTPLTENRIYSLSRKPYPVIEVPWLIMRNRDDLNDFGATYEMYHSQATDLSRKIVTSKSVDVNDVLELRDVQSSISHMTHLYQLQPFNREN